MKSIKEQIKESLQKYGPRSGDAEEDIEADVIRIVPSILQELEADLKKCAHLIEAGASKKLKSEVNKLAKLYKEDYYRSEVEDKFQAELEDRLDGIEVTAKFCGEKMRINLYL